MYFKSINGYLELEGVKAQLSVFFSRRWNVNLCLLVAWTTLAAAGLLILLQ